MDVEQKPTQFDFFESEAIRNIKIQVSDLRDDPERLAEFYNDVEEASRLAGESSKRIREAMRIPKSLNDRRYRLATAI